MNDTQILQKKVVDSNAVRAMVDSKGWKILKNRYKELKDNCLEYFLNDEKEISDKELRLKREVYKNLNYLINIPDEIIKDGLDANEVLGKLLKDEEKKKTSNSKDPFMDR